MPLFRNGKRRNSFVFHRGVLVVTGILVCSWGTFMTAQTCPLTRDILSRRVEASFRDPEGYVFIREGRVYRAIAPELAARLRRAEEIGLLGRLVAREWVVGSRFVREPQLLSILERENPGWHHFAEHDPLPLITYPYEWSVSMLADAAVLTLDLQIELAQAGFSLKDATPFNVQFVGTRPIFIDLGSLDVPSRFDVWYALGQFQRLFLYPLLLARYTHWDLRSYFLSNLNGRDPLFMVRAMGRLGRWRPALLLDVTLPWLLTEYSQSKPRALQSPGSRISINREPMLWNLRRLRRKVLRLAGGYRPQGVWTDYTRTCSYTDRAEDAKREFVRSVLTHEKPNWVLDLGCNTGTYSELAAELGSRVIAADQDHDAIEMLYRRLRNTGCAIWPVVLDITNPSPGIGLNNRERQPFLERARADYVLALALIHHLIVTGNLSLDRIEQLLFDISSRGIIVEFVPPADPMFRKLTQFRSDSFEHITLSAFRRTFSQRFSIVREFPVPDSERMLFWLRRKE